VPDLDKPEGSKTALGRPPPLPASAARTSPAAGSGGALARVKAFLAIQRMRMADRARRAWAWVRRRPILAVTTGAVIVLAAAGGAAILTDSVPEVEIFAPDTIAEARAAVRARPNDAGARRDLGHALWAERKRHSAVLAYTRALALDRAVADDRTIANLLACFGGKDQDEAEALIWKNKLLAAQGGLEALVRSPRSRVRWGAVRTLDRLGAGTRANWETAYIADLDSPDCDVRRTAVDKLGAVGTKRAVTALRAARADDEKTGGLFRSRCLGDRLDDAERKILARR